MRKTLAARRRVDELTARMDRNPGAVQLNQILKEKSVALELDAIVSESGQIFPALRFSRSNALNLTELESVYQVVVTNSEFLSRTIDHHWLHLTELHQRYVLSVQEKANQRLTFLTVASSILLPLTLITGIYGMNFEHMPELKLRYAYPVFLLALALVASGLVIYFKRKGWFD